MSADDDLRGSAPVMSAKDVLLEVRSDVKAMATNVDILVSQNLNERLTTVERRQDVSAGRIAGIAIAVSAVVTLAGFIVTLLTLSTFLKPVVAA